jgi:glutamate 5-kinase
VATLADADLLLTLTDMEGVMDCDPRVSSHACLIPEIEEVTPAILSLAGSTISRGGRGGMATKLEAAAKVRRSGIPMIIVKGKTPEIISRCLTADACGTLVLPAKERIPARKHWIQYNIEPEGEIVVDAGAARALVSSGKSLLPIGVTGVRGTFEDGAAVRVIGPDGRPIAVGLITYCSDEIERIMGHQTAEIDWILGYRRNDEVIHVDNLVLLDTPPIS